MYLVFIMTLYFTFATVKLLYQFFKWKKRKKENISDNVIDILSGINANVLGVKKNLDTCISESFDCRMISSNIESIGGSCLDYLINISTLLGGEPPKEVISIPQSDDDGYAE